MKLVVQKPLNNGGRLLKNGLKLKRNMKMNATNDKEHVYQYRELKNLEYTHRYFTIAEKINSRCAMNGFMWAVYNKFTSGNNKVFDQLFIENDYTNLAPNADHLLKFVVIIALITFGTIVSSLNENDIMVKVSKDISLPGFSERNEMLNGRIAMLAFLFIM